MGIDIDHHHVRKSNRRRPLYTFLYRRTKSKFNKAIVKRLTYSRVTKARVSLSKLVKHGAGRKKAIFGIVGPVVNDSRLYEIPKMEVCALSFTETARARILEAGGKCMTFDELAMIAPTGKNVILLRGPKSHREVNKKFGATGVPHSHVKPKVASKGTKFERARGRRYSRGFRI